MSYSGFRYSEIGQALRLLRSEADGKVVSLGLCSIVVAIASGALAALSPLFLTSLVDGIANLKRVGLSPAASSGAIYLLLLLGTRVLADIRPVLSGTINQRLHSRLTHRFFGHVLHLPMNYLFRRRGGELLHSLDLASAGAQLVVTHLAGSLLPVLVELFTMVTVLVHMGQPRLVIVFSIAALAYIVIFSIGAMRITTAAHEVSMSSLETHAQLTEAISHLETLRYFTAEEQAQHRLHAATCALEKRWQKFNRMNFFIAITASLNFAVSMAASLQIAAQSVIDNALTVGGFVLTTLYMLQMVRPLESLGTAARDLSRAVGYLRPLLELLSEPLSSEPISPPVIVPTAGPTRRRAPAVRLENVHFGYDPIRPVIKGLELEVPAGSTMAIVGRSGSGKSSIARLLMGLYSPQQGRILLDGRDIDLIGATELRRTLVSLVPQETALLHETIAQNIALGTPAASREDIRVAARGAQLQAVVDLLPNGLDTQVGERGMHLSGGERQRIGIARAMLRRPGLYVLDEPTSMLDSKTEFEIQSALRLLSADATTIVIAHRLSTIVHADQIVVLDDGQVLERGDHRALLAHNGLYAMMWRQQMTDPTQ